VKEKAKSAGGYSTLEAPELPTTSAVLVKEKAKLPPNSMEKSAAF
jgi:hypothetical protein